MAEQIKCPFCKQRLFDLISEQVELDIKCPRCKKLSNIKQFKTEHKNQVNHTEQWSPKPMK